MNTVAYKENEEQRLPYIFPVLRSYKQSVMFERNLSTSFEVVLPPINSRRNPAVSSLSKKKKVKRSRKPKRNKRNSSMH